MKVIKLNESISDNPPFIEVDNPDKVDELGYSGAVEYDGFKIYCDEETLRQLERDLQESVNYPNGKEVSNDDVNLDIALDYMFGEDRDPNNDNYTDDEKQRAINYWIEKTDSPFPGWKDKKKSVNEDVATGYVDGDSLKALADEDEYYNKQRARRIHNIELLHKIFDSHGYRDSEDYWTDKVHSIFYNAEEITVVDDASKVPDKTYDGQKVKYVISTPDAEVDIHVDAYGDYVWVVTKQPLNEDVSKEWKPNTSFKHIKDIYNKVKANNYKYVNNEREEFMAAVKKADNKGYKPNECRQIKDWHKDIWSHNRNVSEDLSGKYSDKFRAFIRSKTDSASIVSLVDDIIRYAKEDDLKDLYFEKGYDKLDDDELIESINEKDILNKLDQFKSQITVNKDDEKALKDILLKKNISFKIDDSKANKLTFKLNYKKLNEDLSENGRTVQRYIDSEIPDILVSLLDKLPNMYSSDIDVLFKYCRSFYNLCESLVMYYNKHTKIEEDLTDVSTATLEGPEDGPQFGLTSLLNIAIQKELETVDEYNTLALNAKSEGYEDIANVINEINTEENKHIGQLQELLKTVSPNAEAIDVGKVEGEQQLEEDVLNKPQENDNTNNNKLVEDDNVDWKPIYDKFKQVEKDLNNDGEAVTAIIDKMYQDNKDDPAYQKAYQMWSDGE